VVIRSHVQRSTILTRNLIVFGTERTVGDDAYPYHVATDLDADLDREAHNGNSENAGID